MAESDRKELVVVGGGPGGYAAAFMAADLGIKVTLIDPGENPGGTCLYRGCIPSKSLLHVAKLIMESRDAKEWGLTFEEPKIDIDKLRTWKNDVIGKLTGGLGQLAKQRKVEHVRGMAKFKDAHTLEVNMVEGGTQTMPFETAILASGSEPATIKSLMIDSPHLLNSTTALDLPEIPEKMLIIGGGYIGLEMGTVYASLGSRVSLVEMTSGLLPGVDRDLVAILARRIKANFESVMLKTTVKALSPQKNGIKVSFEGDEAPDGDRIFDKVLMAVGRRPNSEGLGLENTGVEINERGFAKVDEQRRSAEPSIFVIGDLAGEPMLAHKATHEGRIAAEAIAGSKIAYEPQAVPAVVFTDPEVAWAGLTETQAKEQGKEVAIAKFPWGASGRALTLGRSDGLTKLIIDPSNERILGVGIVGPGAGELIAEGVVAIEMAATALDVSLSIHPHPTLSETIMEAAEAFYGVPTHIYRPKKK
jgi:dihydrolipoamide dehydrogenase